MTLGNPSLSNIIWLSEIPFITMIASSVETYKKESCGLLLGYHSWSHWEKNQRAIVEQVYQFQNSKRTNMSVDVPPEEARCKDMIYKLSMYKPLGYFHSHTNGFLGLSKKDISSMNLNEIEVIVSVSDKGRNIPWRYDYSKKELVGVLGDFRFELSAYVLLNKNDKTVKKIDIWCPYALGIGGKSFDIQAVTPE